MGIPIVDAETSLEYVLSLTKTKLLLEQRLQEDVKQLWFACTTLVAQIVPQSLTTKVELFLFKFLETKLQQLPTELSKHLTLTPVNLAKFILTVTTISTPNLKWEILSRLK